MKRNLIFFVGFLTVILVVSGFTARVISKEKPVVFGATYMTKNNPFFVTLHESIEEVVKSNDDILISRDPCQDQNKQNEQILEMIEEGIDILFLNPVDKTKVAPALEACKKNGVEVINIDTLVDDTEYVLSMVETDNYRAGVLCAEELLKKVESARIVLIGNPIQASMLERMQGFKDTIEPYSDYVVVYEGNGNGEFEVSADFMEDFIKKDIKFDVILGGNDPTALGALATLQQYDMDEGVLIYSIDGSPEFKKMIKEGAVEGTCAQSPKRIGRIAALTAYCYLDGKSVRKYMCLEPEMITKENISNYEINGWQ